MRLSRFVSHMALDDGCGRKEEKEVRVGGSVGNGKLLSTHDRGRERFLSSFFRLSPLILCRSQI